MSPKRPCSGGVRSLCCFAAAQRMVSAHRPTDPLSEVFQMSDSLVKDLIDAGIHFGQRASVWSPKMAPYIYAKRNSIHIIDIRETIKGLLLAKKLVTRTVASGKDVCFVGTKRQARGILEQLVPEKMVFITGTIDRSRDRANIQIDQVVPIDKALELYTGMLEITFPTASDEKFSDALKDLLEQHRGNRTVVLKVRATTHPDKIAIIRSGKEFGVEVSRNLIDELEKLLGDQKLLSCKATTVPAAPENPRARFARKQVAVGG